MMRPQGGQSGAMSLDQLQDTAMNVVEAFTSVFARSVELILRPWHGSRYFSPTIVFFSSALMLILPVVSAAASSLTNMIPFAAHVMPPQALFDMGSFAKLYFLLSFIHGIRIWKRMIFPETELHSEWEGPPLPFFYLLPKGKSFWFTRVVLEPAVVLITASVLSRMFIFQSGLANFLQFAALCLCMKNFIAWYRGWQFLRTAMDARAAGPIFASLIENKASQEELSKIHLASFPKNISEDLRQATAVHIARSYSPDFAFNPSTSKGESHADDR